MKQTDKSSFLQLIRIALGNAASFHSPLSAQEWEGMMSISAKQGIAGIAFSGVEKLPKEQMPPLEVIMDWSAVADYTEQENRRLNKVSAKVCEMFERDGKRVCIVKGASVGVFYPEPLRRSAGDVDVWMAGGYKIVAEYVKRKFADVSGGHYGRHVSVDVDGVSVEIHFMPAELYSPLHRRYLKKLYKEIEAKPWICRAELNGGGSIIVPELKDNLIIVTVHLFNHFAVEGVGMKQVLDCYWVLKEVDKAGNGVGKSAESIRNEAMAFFRKVGIDKFVAALMYVLQQLGMEESQMLCAPNVKLGKRLLDDIFETGIVSTEDLVTGKYGDESKPHRFYRRMHRVVQLLPMSPSDMLWVPFYGISYWILRKR